MEKLEKAFKLFDSYNHQDPNSINWEDKFYPAEYFYAMQLYNWVKKISPDASEELLLASRCQHIGRWEIPRSSYPDGKAAYLKWRSDLKSFHAQKVGELLTEEGYQQDIINEVKKIILKKQIKSDSEVQTMENALCLVFLEFQYNEFIKEHDDLKVIRILQKTWAKMSDEGHQAALALNYSERGKQLIETALA